RVSAERVRFSRPGFFDVSKMPVPDESGARSNRRVQGRSSAVDDWKMGLENADAPPSEPKSWLSRGDPQDSSETETDLPEHQHFVTPFTPFACSFGGSL